MPLPVAKRIPTARRLIQTVPWTQEDEAKHPRDAGGEFSTKPGEGETEPKNDITLAPEEVANERMAEAVSDEPAGINISKPVPEVSGGRSKEEIESRILDTQGRDPMAHSPLENLPHSVSGLLQSLHKHSDLKNTGEATTTDLSDNWARGVHKQLTEIKPEHGHGEVRDVSNLMKAHGALLHNSDAGTFILIPPQQRGEPWTAKYSVFRAQDSGYHPSRKEGTTTPVEQPQTRPEPAAVRADPARGPLNELTVQDWLRDKPKGNLLRVNPNTQFGTAVKEVANIASPHHHPKEYNAVHDRMLEIHKDVLDNHQTKNEAYDALRGILSKNRTTDIWRAVRNQDNDASMIPGFDEVTSFAENYYQHAIPQGGYGDFESDVLDFMRTHNPDKPAPQPWDDETVQRAHDWFQGGYRGEPVSPKQRTPLTEEEWERERSEFMSKDGLKQRLYRTWVSKKLRRWRKYGKNCLDCITSLNAEVDRYMRKRYPQRYAPLFEKGKIKPLSADALKDWDKPIKQPRSVSGQQGLFAPTQGTLFGAEPQEGQTRKNPRSGKDEILRKGHWETAHPEVESVKAPIEREQPPEPAQEEPEAEDITARNARLIKAYKQGDNTALDGLVKNNKGLIAKWAIRYSDNPADKEEMMQVGALAVIKSATKFDPSLGVPFGAYIVKRVHGAIDAEARKTRQGGIGTRRENPIKRASDSAETVSGLSGREFGDPANIAVKKQEREFVKKAISMLSDAGARKIMNRWLELGGYRGVQKDIAAEVGLTVGRVSQIIGDSKERMKGTLAQIGGADFIKEQTEPEHFQKLLHRVARQYALDRVVRRYSLDQLVQSHLRLTPGQIKVIDGTAYILNRRHRWTRADRQRTEHVIAAPKQTADPVEEDEPDDKIKEYYEIFKSSFSDD